MFKGNSASLGGLVAAALLGAVAPAAAAPMLQNILPFGDNRGPPTPPVARYVAVQGSSFVFDRESAAKPLIKFDDNPEVWVLEPAPAPRGDTIYRNDVGDTVLRVTRLGGMTLFTSGEPGGMPVAMLGEAEELLPPPVIPPGALLQRMIQASARASRAAQHPITFDAPTVTPQSAPLFTDSFAIAADAVVRMSHKRETWPFLARLDKFTFVMGAKPDVSINGQVMVVTVTPARGFAGRPSSDRMLKAASKR